MAGMSSEKSIEQAIRRYLKGIGAKVEKIHPWAHNGVPDLLGCYRGKFLALEVKKPGGVLSPLQQRELRQWAEAGAIAGRVESVEEVKELLSPLF